MSEGTDFIASLVRIGWVTCECGWVRWAYESPDGDAVGFDKAMQDLVKHRGAVHGLRD